MSMNVPEELQKLGEIYRDRNIQYGDSYKSFGSVLLSLFPNGIHAETEVDMSRLGVLIQIVGKITRYSENFHNYGHDDSLDDLSVYSQMLKSLDRLKIEIFVGSNKKQEKAEMEPMELDSKMPGLKNPNNDEEREKYIRNLEGYISEIGGRNE